MASDSIDLVDDPFANLQTGFPVEIPSARVKAIPATAKTLPAKMPWYWLVKADELGGSALAVGLVALRNRAMTAPYGWPNRVGLESGEMFGLGRRAIRDGLARLADGGLIRYELNPGSKAVVDVLDYEPPNEPESEWIAYSNKSQFIFPRIPLDWISRAALCPTPALIMGLAAWRYDHMTKISGESRFSIEPLAGSNRATSAIRRGLVALQAAGLVELLDAPRGFARLRIVKNVSEITLKGAENGND